MVQWLNHVILSAPRNATATHTVDPSTGTVIAGATFTPTAGRFLVAAFYGGVTSTGTSGGAGGTAPSGWTGGANVAGLNAVNNGGLYVAYKTAAGSDTLVLNHNGTNYPIAVEVFELPAGTTFVKAVAGTNLTNSAAHPALATVGTHSLYLGFFGTDLGSAVSTYTSAVWTGAVTPTELADFGVVFATTDGYGFGSAYADDSATATFTPTATITGSTNANKEAISVAFLVPSGSNTGTLSASVPTVTAALTGTSTNTGTMNATMPVLTYSETGASANTGTISTKVPTLTFSESGASTNLATVSAKTPTVTFAATGQSVNAGTVSSKVPLLTFAEAGTSLNAGTLAAAAPVLAFSESGLSTNPGSLTAQLPLITYTQTDTGSNPGSMNATIPLLTWAEAGQSVNAGTVTTKTPVLTFSDTGTSANAGVLAGAIPLLTFSELGTATNPGALTARLPLLTFTATAAGSIYRDISLRATPLPDRFTTRPLPDRFTTRELPDRFAARALKDRFTTTPLPERFITTTEERTMLVNISSGESAFVGGTLTEQFGKNISAATFLVGFSPDNTTRPATWGAPSLATPGATTSDMVLKKLVTTGQTLGTFWIWGRIADSPETLSYPLSGPHTFS